MKEVHVAVAVIWRDDRLLIARRPEHAHQGGLLEFPGGKVEPGETVGQALVREIAEETGLAVPLGSLQPVIGIRHDYGDKRVFLDVWQTSAATGVAEGREGQPVHWMRLDELRDHDFPAANRAILGALRLPDRYGITGPFRTPAEGAARLAQALATGAPPLVLLRAPWLEPGAYLELARQALELCSAAGSRLMLQGSPAVLASVPEAAGVHLPWREAVQLAERPVGRDKLLAVSCHNRDEVAHAATLAADFITLGPVQPTPSHPGAATLGWPSLAEQVQLAPMPVFALGGVGPGDLLKARAAGSQGIAGISYWW